MGTKTIGVRDDVYERLKARKRKDESFTELMDRLLDESPGDWRDGFGGLESEAAADLERIAAESRTNMSSGLATRQQEVLEELADAMETESESVCREGDE
ncbi:antitoxin VapB family protein [Haloarcula nitratireducens]|uniref:Antitoxin VapB family protein n=1 Tax=Haloarcula nitratireducens TaxID=2487749 RepID=A0AAW4PHX2_9EURY|nr:antitoxin VapB family protein [Halomicroarcula nitratireducens]MBX0297116.1 antitoxin VapB family protein [Halomicroarcula nitratireducens]